MNFLKVEITTPLKNWKFENTLSITAPGVKGSFQVLYNHAPLLNKLNIGEIKLEIPDKKKYFATSGGFLEVINNKVSLLLETCEEAEKIDKERAANAAQRAKKQLKIYSQELDLSRAEAALARALNRLSVFKRIDLSTQ
jgi:F-type H+-transporting ATPase subunit epsilon